MRYKICRREGRNGGKSGTPVAMTVLVTMRMVQRFLGIEAAGEERSMSVFLKSWGAPEGMVVSIEVVRSKLRCPPCPQRLKCGIQGQVQSKGRL